MDIGKMVEKILRQGEKIRAQDYYILPLHDKYVSYFRIGEKKINLEEMESEVAEKMILHLKYRGGMNVGEKRRAQLGGFAMEQGGVRTRYRISTVGDFEQKESLVLRFLHTFQEKDIHCFFEEDLQMLENGMKRRGLYIFSGPTGSGKTTMMYHLAMKKEKDCQIIAIEDPVEIENERILQLQVNEGIGMGYEELIKLCLRHRPDLLLIGEIRDKKTANAVIRATLTGHTVYSTIHAKSKEGVVARMVELGVKEEDVIEVLQGVVYQRLLTDEKGEVKAIFDIGLRTNKGAWMNEGEWQKKLQYLYEAKKISKEDFEKESVE